MTHVIRTDHYSTVTLNESLIKAVSTQFKCTIALYSSFTDNNISRNEYISIIIITYSY